MYEWTKVDCATRFGGSYSCWRLLNCMYALHKHLVCHMDTIFGTLPRAWKIIQIETIIDKKNNIKTCTNAPTTKTNSCNWNLNAIIVMVYGNYKKPTQGVGL